MMIAAEKSVAKVSGKVIASDFSIGDASVILDYMSRTIYSNPIRTVCQEYISNARDAHIECGKPHEPVRIIFPNAFDRAIKIIDQGPGITPERMVNIFTKYGNSTKRGDNAQTGGFGIGSKSGFSYTDTFTIITVSDEDGQRVKRTYVAMKEMGLGPKLMEVGEAQVVTDHTGTTISIEVKQDSDIAEFKKHILSVTQFWDTRPTIEGCNPLPEWPAHEWLFRSKEWGILNCRNRNSFVCIDGIPYDINTQAFGYRELPDYDFVLFFGVGVLHVALNRESIHYDDTTKAVILARVKAMQVGMFAELQAQCESKATFMEACEFASNVNMYVNGKDEFMWHARKCERSLEADSVRSYIPPNTSGNYKSKWRVSSPGYMEFRNRNSDNQVVLIDDTDDTEVQTKKRFQTLMDQGKSDHKFVVLRWKDNVAGMAKYDIQPSDFAMLSTIPRKKVVRGPKGSGQAKQVHLQNVTKYWYDTTTNCMQLEHNNLDLTTSGVQDIVYIPGSVRRRQSVCWLSSYEENQVNIAAKALGKPVYVVPSKYTARQGFVLMNHAMQKKAADIINVNPNVGNVKQLIDARDLTMAAWDNSIAEFVQTHKKKLQAKENSLFMQWFDASQDLNNLSQRLAKDPTVKDFEEICGVFGYPTNMVATTQIVPEIQALKDIKAVFTDEFKKVLAFLDDRLINWNDKNNKNENLQIKTLLALI